MWKGSMTWHQMTIKTKYDRHQKAYAFSLIKNILVRASYVSYFYTWSYDDDWLITIKLRLLTEDKMLRNDLLLRDYIESLGDRVTSCLHEEYKRNHIIELLTQSSPFVIDFPSRLAVEEVGYLIHCIAENFFLDKDEEKQIYEQNLAKLKK